MGINKVMLLGNLGKDPEVRYTPQQMAICQFSLATGERKKDTNGQWVDHTEWHNIVVFGKTAENCARFLKKGRQAFIEGRIRTRKWQDKEGRIVTQPRSSPIPCSSLVELRVRALIWISAVSQPTTTCSRAFQRRMLFRRPLTVVARQRFVMSRLPSTMTIFRSKSSGPFLAGIAFYPRCRLGTSSSGG